MSAIRADVGDLGTALNELSVKFSSSKKALRSRLDTCEKAVGSVAQVVQKQSDFAAKFDTLRMRLNNLPLEFEMKLSKMAKRVETLETASGVPPPSSPTEASGKEMPTEASEEMPTEASGKELEQKISARLGKLESDIAALKEAPTEVVEIVKEVPVVEKASDSIVALEKQVLEMEGCSVEDRRKLTSVAADLEELKAISATVSALEELKASFDSFSGETKAQLAEISKVDGEEIKAHCSSEIANARKESATVSALEELKASFDSFSGETKEQFEKMRTSKVDGEAIKTTLVSVRKDLDESISKNKSDITQLKMDVDLLDGVVKDQERSSMAAVDKLRGDLLSRIEDLSSTIETSNDTVSIEIVEAKVNDRAAPLSKQVSDHGDQMEKLSAVVATFEKRFEQGSDNDELLKLSEVVAALEKRVEKASEYKSYVDGKIRPVTSASNKALDEVQKLKAVTEEVRSLHDRLTVLEKISSSKPSKLDKKKKKKKTPKEESAVSSNVSALENQVDGMENGLKRLRSSLTDVRAKIGAVENEVLQTSTRVQKASRDMIEAELKEISEARQKSEEELLAKVETRVEEITASQKQLRTMLFAAIAAIVALFAMIMLK